MAEPIGGGEGEHPGGGERGEEVTPIAVHLMTRLA
jgi:hypothetical protein